MAIVVLLGVARPAAADPRDDKARVDRALAEVQALYESATSDAQAALAAYTTATRDLPAAQAALADARGVVVAREVRAARAGDEAQNAGVVVSLAQHRIQVTGQAVDDERARLGGFVATLYRGSALATVDAVLSSRTLGDLADRIGYLDQLAATHRSVINSLTAARQTARTARQAAAQAALDAQAARDAASAALDQARAAQTQAEQAHAAVTALVERQAGALATANAQRAAVLARYDALKAESDRIAAELRALDAAAGSRSGGPPAPAPAAGGPTAPAGGRLATPVRGADVSSEFGMRFDPYYHVWQLHAGIDLAAPGGTPIYAAAAGSVARAGWYGGYGNYTCLYHGRYQGHGLSTCYGHQYRILVQPGQWVSQGQLIGLVGTTGASTGYHLHFEVRVDGVPVQPRDWLPGCVC